MGIYLVFLALLAVVPSAGAAHEIIEIYNKTCDTTDLSRENVEKCLQKMEAAAVKRSKGKALRQKKGELSLILRSGAKEVLKDDIPEIGNEFETFHLAEYDARRKLFLVLEENGSGWNFLMVDEKSGKALGSKCDQQYSPAKTSLVYCCYEPQCTECDTWANQQLSLIEFGNDQNIIEHFSKTETCSEGKWIDDTSFSFVSGGEPQTRKILGKKAGKWTVRKVAKPK